VANTAEELLLDDVEREADELMRIAVDNGIATIDNNGNVSINTENPLEINRIKGIVGLKQFIFRARSSGELGPEDEGKMQQLLIQLNKAKDPNASISKAAKEHLNRMGIDPPNIDARLKKVIVSPQEEQFARVLSQMRTEDPSVPKDTKPGRKSGGFFMKDRLGRNMWFPTKSETPEQTIQRRRVFEYGRVPEGVTRADIAVPDVRGPQNESFFEALDVAFPKESQ
jgi:hypothetical protein